MKRSKKGRTVYAEIGFWREPNGSIHLTIKGVQGGHVAVNADPSKPNGHPTLFKRLDKLLKESTSPPDITLKFIAPDGRVVSTKKFGKVSN